MDETFIKDCTSIKDFADEYIKANDMEGLYCFEFRTIKVNNKAMTVKQWQKYLKDNNLPQSTEHSTYILEFYIRDNVVDTIKIKKLN